MDGYPTNAMRTTLSIDDDTLEAARKLATLDRGVAELIADRQERARWVEWTES
jgi:hypothetical protein